MLVSALSTSIAAAAPGGSAAWIDRPRSGVSQSSHMCVDDDDDDDVPAAPRAGLGNAVVEVWLEDGGFEPIFQNEWRVDFWGGGCGWACCWS